MKEAIKTIDSNRIELGTTPDSASILKSYIVYGLAISTMTWMDFCEKYDFEYEALVGFIYSFGVVGIFICGIWFLTMRFPG